MVRCQGRNRAAQALGFKFMAPRPEPRDAFWPVEQRFGGSAAQENQDLRFNQFDLPLDEREAGSRLGLRPDQVYVNIERVGNTSAASIPIALDEAARRGRLKRGDNVVFAAFGTGLTWGAAVCKWGW